MSASVCLGNIKEGPKTEGKMIPFSGGVLTLGICSDIGQPGCNDGSLPTSPVSDCEELTEAHFKDCQNLDRDTSEIINDFLQKFTGLSRSCGQHRKIVQTMSRVVEGLVVKHEIVYKGAFLTKGRDLLLLWRCLAGNSRKWMSPCATLNKTSFVVDIPCIFVIIYMM